MQADFQIRRLALSWYLRVNFLSRSKLSSKNGLDQSILDCPVTHPCEIGLHVFKFLSSPFYMRQTNASGKS